MTDGEAPKAEKTHRFPCTACGADAEYVPRVGMKCPYCGHSSGVPQNEDQLISESSYEEYLRAPRGPQGYGAAGARDISCKDCGASTRVSGEVASAACAYCGSPVVIEDGPDEGVVRPEAVLPFQVTKQLALESFRTWVNGLWFAPNALKKLNETDRIFGVYRPYWTFDTATHSWYHGQRGEYYYVAESYTDTEIVNGQSRTVTKTREVRKTRWYPASGQVASFFDDVLVPGGRPLGWSTDYNLDMLCPYDPGFLAGWQAERYTVPPEKAWPVAKEEVDAGVYGLVCRDIGGDEQRVDSVRTSYNAIKFKHLLLPLYIASYFYMGKTYRFQVNGASGAVNGERPYSFWKIAILVLVILGAIGILALIGALAGNK